jgi:hypothetical protein
MLTPTLFPFPERSRNARAPDAPRPPRPSSLRARRRRRARQGAVVACDHVILPHVSARLTRKLWRAPWRSRSDVPWRCPGRRSAFYGVGCTRDDRLMRAVPRARFPRGGLVCPALKFLSLARAKSGDAAAAAAGARAAAGAAAMLAHLGARKTLLHRKTMNPVGEKKFRSAPVHRPSGQGRPWLPCSSSIGAVTTVRYTGQLDGPSPSRALPMRTRT